MQVPLQLQCSKKAREGPKMKCSNCEEFSLRCNGVRQLLEGKTEQNQVTRV